MFAIEVELLTGRYVATAHDDRRRAEWPPHPARLFSALVAAHAEGGKDEAERAALLWLERQPSPVLEVSEALRRDTLDVFVPVNDVAAIGDLEASLRQRLQERERLSAEGASDSALKKANQAIEKAKKVLAADLDALRRVPETPSKKSVERAGALLPERRVRQVRQFPVAIPVSPLVCFGWPEPPPEATFEVLARLCARLTRLGHSSSLVWCRPVARAVRPTLIPRPDGDLVLRTIGPGQLQRLDRAWEQHQGVQGRVLPALPQRYGPPMEDRAPPAQSHFEADGWILFERVGRRNVMASKCVDLAQALRGALLEQHGAPGLPAQLSGHGPDGRPALLPHLSFVSLPSVGNQHADGSVKGCAIVLPRGLSTPDREHLLRLVAKWEQDRSDQGALTLGGIGLAPIRFERVLGPSMETTRPGRWSRTASRFVTVTPIALDRNPGNLRSNFEGTAHKAARAAEETIAAACQHIGLPRPRSVSVSFDPLIPGVMPVRAFRPLKPRPGRPQRVLVHALIDFDGPVRGPVLLGAGRHFGLGLCLPMEVDDVAEA